MVAIFRVRRRIGAAVLVAVLIGLTAALAAGMVSPDPVPSAALGPDWQCTRLAFVFTSCTRIVGVKTAAADNGTAPSCRRPTAWLNALGLVR